MENYLLRSAIDSITLSSQDKLILAGQAISANYRKGTNKDIPDKISAQAYCIARMPATVGAITEAVLSSGVDFSQVKSVVDLGAGTGGVGFCFADNFDVTDVVCVEKNLHMLSLGKTLYANSSRAVLQKAKWVHCDVREFDLPHADCITLSYIINELSFDDAVSLVRRSLEKSRLVVIIDAGTPSAFGTLRKIRNLVIKEGFFAIAPCPHDGECPIEQDDWCHFTARVARTKLQKAIKGGDSPYEDEKFCYLVLSQNDKEREGRILRHPMITAGKVSLSVCSKSGVKNLLITKSHPNFKKARKSHSGDNWQA